MIYILNGYIDTWILEHVVRFPVPKGHLQAYRLYHNMPQCPIIFRTKTRDHSALQCPATFTSTRHMCWMEDSTMMESLIAQLERAHGDAAPTGVAEGMVAHPRGPEDCVPWGNHWGPWSSPRCTMHRLANSKTLGPALDTCCEHVKNLRRFMLHSSQQIDLLVVDLHFWWSFFTGFASLDYETFGSWKQLERILDWLQSIRLGHEKSTGLGLVSLEASRPRSDGPCEVPCDVGFLPEGGLKFCHVLELSHHFASGYGSKLRYQKSSCFNGKSRSTHRDPYRSDNFEPYPNLNHLKQQRCRHFWGGLEFQGAVVCLEQVTSCFEFADDIH